MKFLAILALSLIGSSVALPLERRAIRAREVSLKAARAEAPAAAAPSAAAGRVKAAAARPAAAAAAAAPAAAPARATPATGGAAKPRPSTAGGGAAAGRAPPAAAPAAPEAADPAAPDTPATAPATAAPATAPAPAAPVSPAPGTSNRVAPNLQTGGKPNGPGVQYAAGAFANDATTVSGSLNALRTERDTEMIRSLAAVAFKAESDEDKQRDVLNTSGASQAQNANSLIVKNTPAVLDGLQAIMNDPTVENAQTQLKGIEIARNANILPSITELTNAAMTNAGLQPLAVVFPATGPK